MNSAPPLRLRWAPAKEVLVCDRNVYFWEGGALREVGKRGHPALLPLLPVPKDSPDLECPLGTRLELGFLEELLPAHPGGLEELSGQRVP